MIKKISTNKAFSDMITNNDKLIIIEFGASWCGACTRIKSFIENLAEDFKDDCIFCEIDIDIKDIELLLEKFEIESVPQFFFIKDTKIVYKQSGGDKMNLLFNINKFKI